MYACVKQKFIIHLFRAIFTSKNYERETDRIDAIAELYTNSVRKCNRSAESYTPAYIKWKKRAKSENNNGRS